MQSKAQTVSEYLASLPDDRRKALQAIRKVLKQNLGKGYKEGMQYGMIGYFVPHSVYPDGYHCDPKQPLPFAGLASQKNYISIYLMCVYGHKEHEQWFQKAWKATGKKLDMGKSCVRVKSLDDVALDVLGEAVRRVPVEDFIAYYEEAIKGASKRPARKKVAKKATRKAAAGGAKKKVAKRATKEKVAKTTTSKKATSKKTTRKKTAKKATSR